jgi:hypothetical protein
LLDNCGTCDNDPSNDCVEDCTGTWGGSLVDDGCGICGGDNSTCADCAGVPGGGAVFDECGVCGGNGPIDGLCDGAPAEFLYNQSNQQAFYFFLSVTVDGISVESNDWVGAFNGNVCVGARQWDQTGTCSDAQYTEQEPSASQVIWSVYWASEQEPSATQVSWSVYWASEQVPV